MNNVTVTVSPQAKVEFLMLVNLAMGLEVGQSLEIRDTTYCSYITFKSSRAQVLFFSDLHVQWYNKDLKPAPIKDDIVFDSEFCVIFSVGEQWFRKDKITGDQFAVNSYIDQAGELVIQ